jgi:hypothetical protein
MATTTTTTTTTKTKKTTTHHGAKNVKKGAGKAKGGKGGAKGDGKAKGYFVVGHGGRGWGPLTYIPGVLPGSTPKKCVGAADPAPLQFTSRSAIFPAKRFF